MAVRRKKKDQPISLLAGKKATVALERNGVSIRIDDVDADTSALVAADLLAAFRVLAKQFPELIQELQPVGGYTPVAVTDDDWAEDGRSPRAGFRA